MSTVRIFNQAFFRGLVGSIWDFVDRSGTLLRTCEVRADFLVALNVKSMKSLVSKRPYIFNHHTPCSASYTSRGLGFRNQGLWVHFLYLIADVFLHKINWGESYSQRARRGVTKVGWSICFGCVFGKTSIVDIAWMINIFLWKKSDNLQCSWPKSPGRIYTSSHYSPLK